MRMLSLLSLFLFSFLVYAHAQSRPVTPKGKLFIIGGGDRPPSLMKSLVKEAALRPSDYVIVLPMASAYPDTAYHYIKLALAAVCDNPVVNFSFSPVNSNHREWLDSLEKAKLVFIAGGDQDRFMQAVNNTPVYSAIHRAYQNGATIAGTSAGAAVMSEHMITGRELTDTSYHATFRKIVADNIEIKQGLGLIKNAIIDQHFIVRSRYNRLFSALAKYPALTCIGVDEATAIVVSGEDVTVTGESQVVVIQKPNLLQTTATGLVKFRDIQFSIYTEGDRFKLVSAPSNK
jgi:cyanophycinase